MTQGSDDALIGGRYRLIRRVGRGGMGTVWQARDELLERIVAIKQLTSAPGATAEARARQAERITREARMAARLDHPGIVRVHGVVDWDGMPAIDMEYVDGRSLGALLREAGPLSVAETVQLGLALLDALRHAHDSGVVHRDLKPDNVLLSGSRTVITDFGIALPVDGTVGPAMRGAGTPEFMAPEQIEGNEATPASDLWSLGATLYVAVEGALPFRGETSDELCAAVLTEPMRMPGKAGPLAPLLQALLAKDPAARANAASSALQLTAIDRATDTGAEPVTRAEAPSWELHLPGEYPALIQDQESAEAARLLAQEMRTRWNKAEEEQGIADTRPMRVQWKQASGALKDQSANVSEAQLLESGDLDQIDKLYRQLPAGRLVVLGEAGSGKTTLAMRFALNLLGSRDLVGAVPVIFNLASWNPAADGSLRDWLTGELERDYSLPFLARAGQDGSTLAAALVMANRILPILDGFDEIAEGLRPAALEALNAVSRMPMVLTSRPEAYVELVEGTRGLKRAACIELVDLTLADLEDYLHLSAPSADLDGTGALRTAWHPVLDELHEHPREPANANLRRALKTPLMVWLARTIYSNKLENEPSDLLDAGRFKTAEAIEDHLVGAYIPTVYSKPYARNWDAEHASRWLTYLARHLEQRSSHSPGVAWWELGTAMSRRKRIIVVGLVSGAFVGLLNAFVAWFALMFFNNLWTGTRFGPLVAFEVALLNLIMDWLVAAPIFGLFYGIWLARTADGVLEPSRVHMRMPGRRKQPEAKSVSEILARARTGLLLGLSGGAVVGFVGGLSDDRTHRLATGVMYAAVLGISYALGAGLALTLVAWFEAPIASASAASPRDLLYRTRKSVLLQLLLIVPAFGLTFAVGLPVLAELLHASIPGVQFLASLPGMLSVGLVISLVIGVGATLCLTAWGQWVVFARIWLPLTGKLPWRVLGFLEDAHQRGVLRQSGAVYQFRHARLQGHLGSAAERREQ